jgi:8-oxo-dGTP diphosphatase
LPTFLEGGTWLVYNRRRGTALVESPEGFITVSENGKLFLLPGGGARKGESRESAAKRELYEETGLESIQSAYLFPFKGRVHKSYNGKGHFRDLHKVFLIKTSGPVKPRGEIKYIAYCKGSEPNLASSAKKIIEKYQSLKMKVAELTCKRCGAPLKFTDSPSLIKCEYCQTVNTLKHAP